MFWAEGCFLISFLDTPLQQIKWHLCVFSTFHIDLVFKAKVGYTSLWSPIWDSLSDTKLGFPSIFCFSLKKELFRKELHLKSNFLLHLLKRHQNKSSSGLNFLYIINVSWFCYLELQQVILLWFLLNWTGKFSAWVQYFHSHNSDAWAQKWVS